MAHFKNLSAVLTFVFLTWFCTDAEARRFRVGFLPNGSINRCSNCHDNPGGGGSRTSFGEDVNGLVTRNGRQMFWTPEFAAEDSDDDGVPNGAELGDLDGDGTPERTVNISHPGRANSVPAMALGDCNLDTDLNADDLSCVSDIAARDAVLEALNTLPGDLDGNGQVAFLDFLILAENFGSESASYAEGNIDLVGPVSFLDFLELANNFGMTREAALPAVPEPSVALMATIGVCSVLPCRRRRKGSKE